MRLVSAGNRFNVASRFRDLVDDAIIVHNSDHEFEEGDILILEGGTDISTHLYNQAPIACVQRPDKERDIMESRLFNQAVSKGVPILGICRGAQLVCALSGGSLIQDVDNHCDGEHIIFTNEGSRINMSSVHHQMMYPWDIPHELLAWTVSLASNYTGQDNSPVVFPEKATKNFKFIEPEMVYFPDTKSLAIQGHPEFMAMETLGVQYCRTLFKEYLLSQKEALHVH